MTNNNSPLAQPTPAKRFFTKISSKVTRATGNPITFIIAVLIIVAWAVAGPIFGFSDTWQLVINTGTTIITFLMVFVIQQSQNRDTIAIQLKLNELIACNAKASNRLIEIEELTDDELDQLKRFYARLVDLAQEETDIHRSHSIDEAQKSHKEKHP
ncbi:low affinity iron permease family protein [Flavihumibacter solisilvae]|jgi:low affinity Fe/Cu permease|uniref:low affinity iron permease family protein n=1 Tax=Flavihumibacter solisilvae TaxID=1349421 RepID=UPI00068C3E0F|nr:low affinity iron permease family protein [Flavihumibacter solisilvae]